MNVLLIGMRASGKSTVGAALARRLSIEFFDLDHVVAKELGHADAAGAIRTHGFQVFRSTEVASLEKLLRSDGVVIALGGGTPTAPDAPRVIRAARYTKSAQVVFLDEKASAIKARIARDGISNRPPIRGKDAIEEVDEVLADRRPLYLELADIVIVPNADSIDVIVDEIIKRLNAP